MINRRIVPISFNLTALFAALLQINLTAAPQLTQDENLAKAFEYIEDSEYEISWAVDQSKYKAPNRAQNLRFTFESDTLAVEPRDNGEGNAKPWEFSLQFEGATKGERPISVANPSWRVDHKHAEIKAPGIIIEYQNEREGLRQNFRVLTPPDGNKGLMLNFKVSSQELSLEVNEDQVSFTDAKGENVVLYSDLNVWDANEKRLTSSMVSLGGDRFAIAVDDSTAAYPIFVDPLIGGTPWTETQSGEKFGYAVADLVDKTDDDLQGVVVGAPYYDTGSYFDAGKVFVFAGEGSFPSTNTWTIQGDQTNARIGWSVAADGDLNGDGHGDIAIGAPYYSGGGAGKVWVYPGGVGGPAWGSTNPIFTSFPSVGSSAYYGYSLTYLPDINSDDRDELVVGAPGFTTDSSAGAGRVFMYFGGSTPDTTADWTVYGGSAYLQLGYSMAHAENIKGLAESDLVVGAPQNGIYQGAIYVFYKSGMTLGTTPTTILGQNNGDKFGFSVAGAFDQNNDGYNDILVGAPYWNNVLTHQGRAYLFRGGPSGIGTSSTWTLDGGQTNAQLGFSIAGGDVDHDGFGDILIGAPYYHRASNNLTECGLAFSYITNPATGMPPLTNIAIWGIANYDHNGSSVAYLGYRYYRGWLVGAPDAHNGAGTLLGGTVTSWKGFPIP